MIGNTADTVSKIMRMVGTNQEGYVLTAEEFATVRVALAMKPWFV